MSVKQNKMIKEVFTLDVDTDGGIHKGSFEVDKNADKIIGIAICSSRDDIAYYRGAQAIKINEEEFFPENFETKNLMSGLNVPPNLRFYRLGNIDPGNRKVEIIYTDSGLADVVAFEAHKIFLYVYSSLAVQPTE
ncbi:MAG TPA: hypothetical protein VK826_00230 [Bacteroidia bacterium]|nr:hypothetical protein [Bacteroidia bacterium]